MILSQSKAKQMYLSMLLVKNVDRVLGLFRACIMALVQNEIHYTHLICNIMSISRLRWGERKCDSICLIVRVSAILVADLIYDNGMSLSLALGQNRLQITLSHCTAKKSVTKVKKYYHEKDLGMIT